MILKDNEKKSRTENFERLVRVGIDLYFNLKNDFLINSSFESKLSAPSERRVV